MISSEMETIGVASNDACYEIDSEADTDLRMLPDRECIAILASSLVDITTNPRRREALSGVARITQWDTVP